MGIVLQNNFLFTGTVMDNIRVGKLNATDEEVIDAARKLDTLDLFDLLPQGFHTPVGERGGGLSVGQRQLVCFTRAMLADPKIMILDEATSAIDTLTEVRIQKALAILLRHRTSFVVAHRSEHDPPRQRRAGARSGPDQVERAATTSTCWRPAAFIPSSYTQFIRSSEGTGVIPLAKENSR